MGKKIKKNAVVLTARDLMNGYVAEKYDVNLYNMTPLQMIPEEEKDEDWKKWNLDWLERVGMRQIVREAPAMKRKYDLANGIININDYVIGDHNPMSEHLEVVQAGMETNTLPLRFFPLIPSIMNVMLGEFSKRDTRIIAAAVDPFTQKEIEKEKKEIIENLLVQQAVLKEMQKYQELGLEQMSEDQLQAMQQELEITKELAALPVKFKNYRSIPEQWANHVINWENERFEMYRKEMIAFKDLLTVDKEFWHIRLKKNDYSIELWNPLHTFYHKSPDVYYISESNYAGRIRMMSIPDVIDLYGELMTEEQLLELKNGYKVVSNLPLVDSAYQGRADYYTNYSKPFPESITNQTWGKFMDGKFRDYLDSDHPTSNNEFNLSWYDLSHGPSNYFEGFDTPGMVRVTDAYWRSQRRVGELTRVMENGQKETGILIDETYKVKIKPVYDKSINQKETKENLVYGEHIDWTWINQVRFGIKINSSLSSYYTRNYSTFEPIYIGGDPLEFQFKAEDNLYGAKIPVEGLIGHERNSKASGFVDRMESHQITFNVLNNQILELLADDIGNVIVIDQNMVPRNSMGKEWGPNNFGMFYQVMKNYQIAPLDPSIRNTESLTNFAHFQSVDLSKTNQIMTRLKLAEYVKNEAFSTVGITPQRLGSVAASESATGVQQAINNSYAQTEPWFDLHINHIMPRVRQLSLDAAQYIASTQPISSVRYMNREEENIFFDIEGYKLLLRDFRIYCKSTPRIKERLEMLRRLAMENNTAGGSLYDLAQVMTLDSVTEIIAKLKEADDRLEKQQAQEREHEQQMLQMQMEQQEKQAEREDKNKELDRIKDITVAQIRASQSKDNDVNADSIPDPLQALDLIEKQKKTAADILNMERTQNFSQAKHADEMMIKERELDFKNRELIAKERMNRDNNKTALKNKTSGEK